MKNTERESKSYPYDIKDIGACRTEAFGGHVDHCTTCGTKHVFYHSCYNRSCPQCQGTHAKKWLDKHSDKLLPVHYFLSTTPLNA
ncbi:MAG: transposase zinc-binding domain-containing protein [Candidatus Omnitrophota bacterium]